MYLYVVCSSNNTGKLDSGKEVCPSFEYCLCGLLFIPYTTIYYILMHVMYIIVADLFKLRRPLRTLSSLQTNILYIQ